MKMTRSEREVYGVGFLWEQVQMHTLSEARWGRDLNRIACLDS